jgi:hypothetical protein
MKNATKLSLCGFDLIPFLNFTTTRHAAVSTLFVFALGACCSLHSQTLNPSAQITGVSAGPNTFNYTISLQNTAASTDPISTFWYAWIPGEDFLPSNPLSISAPAGWSGVPTHFGAGDGYAIQFTTSTAPLAPGASLDFQFQSSDTPAQLAGNSPYYPTTPVGTSYVYAGAPFASLGQQFAVQSVPEPSTSALLIIGCLGLLAWRVRREA